MRTRVVPLLLLLGACASAPKDRGWYTPPSSLEAGKVPPCAFEDPYLPEPCYLTLPGGERLVVRNPRPQEETRHHGWLWWFLMTLVAI